MIYKQLQMDSNLFVTQKAAWKEGHLSADDAFFGVTAAIVNVRACLPRPNGKFVPYIDREYKAILVKKFDRTKFRRLGQLQTKLRRLGW